jgi:Arc/MetJ-type ribon-helix-helix transcriptional regulator
MPQDQEDSAKYIGRIDDDNDAGESLGQCDICGDTDSLSRYSLQSDSDIESMIDLCPSHHRVAALLGGSDYADLESSPDYDLQETGKITVRVPKALIDGADAVAEQQGQTRSEFVRDTLQMALELQKMSEAFDEILSAAVESDADTETETDETAADVEFLKERIRKLESLLEDSIDKF